MQEEAILSVIADKKDTFVLAPTSLGKCWRGDTDILMYDGSSKNIKDIIVGDIVMGHDSTPRAVLSLARGREKLYEIRPIRGKSSYYVTGDHVLCLRRTEKVLNESIRHKEITVNDYIKASNNFKHLHKWYKKPVTFSTQVTELPLDPYFLGLWLGDGNSSGPAITTIDTEIIDYVADFATKFKDMSIRVATKESTKACTYFLTCGRKGPNGNPISNILRDLNLKNNKHIPLIYKTQTEANRLQLLAGILDTDGSLDISTSQGFFEYVSVSKELCEDVIYLARSLGFYCSLYESRKTCTNNGVTGTYWRTNISGDIHRIPTKLPRKQCKEIHRRTDCTNIGFTVHESVEDDYYGFMIDGDHKFLLADFSVVHNSLIYQCISLSLERTDYCC